MAIKVNGETVPVTISEMEPLFNSNSGVALSDAGLRIVLNMTNDEGKRNWLTLAKKYGKPQEIKTAKNMTTVILIAAGVVGAFLLYKSNKKN